MRQMENLKKTGKRENAVEKATLKMQEIMQ
jgi:hypothetical protein